MTLENWQERIEREVRAKNPDIRDDFGMEITIVRAWIDYARKMASEASNPVSKECWNKKAKSLQYFGD